MLSTIILAYNRCNEVLITIGLVKSYALSLPFEVEIIVVDNASVDDTSARVASEYPDVKLVTKTTNNGIAGWNDGFSEAKFKYFLVLDDDSNPESGIAEAVDFLEKNNDTGILALNVISGPYLTDDWIWSSGSPWQHGEEIIGFFGCGAIIRKTVFEKIGGFSEWMLVYGHEWDYGIRCMDAGFKIRYFKSCHVAHRASVVNRSLKRSRVFGTRNDMAIVYKYFGEKRWKYIGRMFFNNLKRIKNESALAAWYDVIGTIEFLKFRRTLVVRPVRPETQYFFADNYLNTHPVFRFITKRIKKLGSK